MTQNQAIFLLVLLGFTCLGIAILLKYFNFSDAVPLAIAGTGNLISLFGLVIIMGHRDSCLRK